MSIKVHQQQQFKVPQGTKVYLVNPESLRHNNNVIINPNLQIAKVNNHNNLQQQQDSATVKVFSAPKVNPERKYRKRKIESVDLSYEDEEDIVFSKIYSKETTTRAGRISKSRHLATTSGVKSIKSSESQTTEQTNGVKVKKREPASVFRCAICQKVYIGFKKLNLHFKKFPDHYNSTETSRPSKFLHCETQTEGCIINNSAKVDVQIQVPTPTTTATADSEVSKILSPPPPPLRELNTINKPDNNNYSFVSSLLLNPNDEPEHTLCLQTTSNGLSHRSHHHRSPTNSNDFCEQNFSPYRNTSSNQVELGESNGMMGGSMFYDHTIRHSPIANNTNHSIHSRSTEQQSGSHSHHRQNNNSPLSSSSISPLTTKNHHNHHSGMSSTEIPHHFSPSIQKRAWDLIEEKMAHQGINEILLELNDVAEKLSKIARDKIIPIREEEEERLRAHNNVPIVQVDSPFLSHLLDLPFGTYKYIEDAGVRLGLLPPPVPAELSLTGGEEVDVGKFLTPDIDLINLPHLTNIDFAAICSNN